MNKLLTTAGILMILNFIQLTAQPIISSTDEDEFHIDSFADLGGSLQWQAFKKAIVWNLRTNRQLSPISDIEELGPQKVPGRVKSMVVDSKNNLYLGVATGGGIWKFSPTDHSWLPLNDQFPNLAFTGITQNPNHHLTLLAASGDPTMGVSGTGIFKSTDGAVNFNPINGTSAEDNPDFTYTRFINYSPYENGVVFWGVGNFGNDKLYRSGDGGETWNQVLECYAFNIHLVSIFMPKASQWEKPKVDPDRIPILAERGERQEGESVRRDSRQRKI